jgi:hypothetical protein
MSKNKGIFDMFQRSAVAPDARVNCGVAQIAEQVTLQPIAKFTLASGATEPV